MRHLLLEQCEAIIKEGLKNLEKVERAFEIIEQEKLYKYGFENLESYYAKKWESSIELPHLSTIQHQKKID